MADSSVCASLTQGVVAFNISDLVPNGYINEVHEITGDQSIRLLPSNRLTVELQYSITAATGTTLNDLAGSAGVGGLLGTLGGGSGFVIGQGIGSTLHGDFEPTNSYFTFHVCESKTYINYEVKLTQNQIDLGEIELPHYIMGVMSVTKNPLELTDEQRSFIGRSGGVERGANPNSEGLIETDFSIDENLFVSVVRDERKLLFRADNKDGLNCFKNNSLDDLVDKSIIFQSAIEEDEYTQTPLFEVGDSVFITYCGVSNHNVRHAIYTSSFFFLFPGPFIERIGQDRVRGWNFKPMKFKCHKDELNGKRATAKSLFDDPQDLDDIFGQRITEAFWDNTTNRPYIRGFYIADIRGIHKVSFYSVSFDFDFVTELIAPANLIRDQIWWQSFINTFLITYGGHNNGEFDFSNMDSLIPLLQKGFLFDVSQHVNSCVYDNEKLGYQKDLAEALTKVSAFDSENTASGIGFSNLDLEENLVPGREAFDASSVVFLPIKMSSVLGGAYFVRDCNKIFNQEDLFFQGSSFLQADMFIRTPVFFDKINKNSRIYMERFSPSLGLSPDGGIWVTTNPFSSGGFSVDVHPNGKVASLVFSDPQDNSLRYHLMDDGVFRLRYQQLEEDSQRSHSTSTIAEIAPSDLRGSGYDRLLGNEPGYSNGIEISTEMGKLQRGVLKTDILYESFSPSFQVENDDITISVNGLEDRRVKEINITYVQLLNIDDENDIQIIFPNYEHVIDHIYVNNVSIGQSETLTIHCPFYHDSQMIIKGDALKHIRVVGIDIFYLKEEIYEQSRVLSSDVSTVFDANGNWFVFYEDTNAHDGTSVITTEGDNALQNASFTEISCLMSYDQGLSWYDYKAIIRTAGDESIRSPYAVVDRKSDLICLFFILNDSLFHTFISAKSFLLDDSFIPYKRPQRIDIETSDIFGLEGFSSAGRNMRLSEYHLVAGNLEEDFLKSQFVISEGRIDNRKSPRFVSRCNEDAENVEFSSDFNSSYCAYLDRQGFLRVLYFQDTKMFCKISNNKGLTWEHIDLNGIDFHKINSLFGPKTVGYMGVLYDENSNNVSIVYQSEGMLFVKNINGHLFLKKEDFANTTNINNASVFVVGSISEEFKKTILNEDNEILFPYPPDQLNSFNEDMALQQISSRGYIGSGGFSRFFYRDANGDIKAFTFQSTIPILDARLVINND